MEQEISSQNTDVKKVSPISSIKITKNLLTFLLLVFFILLVIGNIVLFFLPHSPILDFLIYGW
ncbi:hypothetical protein BH11PAT1_BH11PAT1_6670 [soil metagenome]